MPSSRARRTAEAPIYVSILSANPETIDGLQAYFGGVGVPSHGTRAAKNLDLVVPERATAVVIFPDDFAGNEVRSLVRALRRSRPRLLALVVTRTPQRFRDDLEPDGGSLPLVVLPKPSFGWDILDAIRAHADGSQVGA